MLLVNAEFQPEASSHSNLYVVGIYLMMVSALPSYSRITGAVSCMKWWPLSRSVFAGYYNNVLSEEQIPGCYWVTNN